MRHDLPPEHQPPERRPDLEANDERIRNARPAREIHASQQLSGTSTTVNTRFAVDGVRRVVSRDPFSGHLVVDWEQVGREQDEQ